MTTNILLTVGEPAGIGPDCIIRAWHARPEAFAHVTVAAPSCWLNDRANLIGLPTPISESRALQHVPPGHGLHCWNPLGAAIDDAAITPGAPNPATADAAIACIEAAAMACLQHDAGALVTGPIDKAVFRDAGFVFPGHTEFLAELAGIEQVVMMLASEQLRVALLTTHMAISEVPAELSVEQTLSSLRIISDELHRRFGIADPRLGLCGLNPHAGEAGHFGREEIDILAPAVAQARSEDIHVQGPLSADSIFSPYTRKQFDAIICCYHDQGLIPIKALSFGDAVNITLGLPFVRTSVDHGTALDRAGMNKVSYSSLMAAIDMANMMCMTPPFGETDCSYST
ncbi:MAG: 4-hydroxythreonine-4-phosphate dehydrogenase PdxA [Mariprofundaceae bacterium]